METFKLANRSASNVSIPAVSHFHNASPRRETITSKDIQTKPWKYIGYRGYASFIASDTDFFILRRFAQANSLVALALQDQVSETVDELERLDVDCSQKEAADINNGSFRNNIEERRDLLDELHIRLNKYNSFIIQQNEMKRFIPALRHDIQSVRDWHQNHDWSAISTEEQQYLSSESDLVYILPKEKTPLRRLLDQCVTFRHHSFFMDKMAPAQPLQDDMNTISYFSDKRMDHLVNAIILGFGMAMLVAPMWILQAVHPPNAKLGIITVFIVVFLAMVSYATNAKPTEALGATAAYSAVLMVFMQLAGNTS